MRRLKLVLTVATAFSPVLALAESTFSMSTGAISGGFLMQQGRYGYGAGRDFFFANFVYGNEVGNLRYRLSLGLDSAGDETLFDDSFIEQEYGHWAVGLGAKTHHWGPSRYTSLVLSDNTRPVPSLYFSREPGQFESQWLSWMGDVSADILVGQLAEHTAPSNTKLLGMRLDMNPLPGLEFEFVRMVQFGGDGRDNSVETFLKILSGVFDANGIVSNQIAGFGVSYELPSMPLRGYLQAVGEDEAGYLPSCYFYLAGLELRTDLFDAPSILTLEMVDTQVERTSSGFCGPNTAYTNGQYASGYSHYGNTMGAPIDTEGVSLTLYGEHQLPAFDLSWSLGHYDINKASLASHRLAPANVSGLLATVGFSKNWDDLSVQGVLAFQDFDLTNAPGGLSAGFKVVRDF